MNEAEIRKIFPNRTKNTSQVNEAGSPRNLKVMYAEKLRELVTFAVVLWEKAGKSITSCLVPAGKSLIR